MTEAFDKAFELLMEYEGGYSNDPADRGGETRFGISKRCLAPDVRVATRDLRWRPVSELNVGDELVGFRAGERRATIFDVTSVLAIGPVRLPAAKLYTSIGELICSLDHIWWATRRGGSEVVYNWKMTSQLRIGDEIRIWREPWEESIDAESGYLAGLLDGEASINKGTITFFQNDGPVLDQFISILKARSIHFGRSAAIISHIAK